MLITSFSSESYSPRSVNFFLLFSTLLRNITFLNTFKIIHSFYFLQIDHFGFLEDGTFKQRYLVADKYWHHPGGPILFYTGNEGDIAWFCNNTVNKLSCYLVFTLHVVIFSLVQHMSFVFSSGLHVGHCGGDGRHASFCRTSLLWGVTAIWTRLLQCR